MSKLSNELTMIELLSSGKKYSIKELSDILEVTPRMIRIYKDDLEEAGVFVDTIKGIYGGYVLNRGIKLIRDEKGSEIILDKEKQKTFNLLSKAISEKRKVEITHNKKNEIIKRIIKPLSLMIKDDKWYCSAYNDHKKALSLYDLETIIQIKILNENYK